MKLTSHIKVYRPYEVCMKSASYFKVHIYHEVRLPH